MAFRSATDSVRQVMVSFISDVLSNFPGRGSCTTAEKDFGRFLGKRWREDGHQVREEPFLCSPTAFLGFFPGLGVLYGLAIYFYWSAPGWVAGMCLLGLLTVILESCLYCEFIDFAFPTRWGVNLVGVISPPASSSSSQSPAPSSNRRQTPIRTRVVVSAHQDAAYEFNLWWMFRHGGVPMMVLCLIGLIAPLAGSLISLLSVEASSLITDTDIEEAPMSWFEFIGLLSTLLWPVQAMNFMFHSGHIVPGAMDNLAGISILVGLSDLLRRPANQLKNTEVVLLGTSSEECGLRGAKRFASAHRERYRADERDHQIKTCGIFVDGIYDERHLTIVTRELTTLAKHDPKLIQLATRTAEQLDVTVKKAIIPFGASDASAFSTAGIPSVGILCQDTSQLVHNYHTRDDLQHLVRPESLTTTLDLVFNMIKSIDQQD